VADANGDEDRQLSELAAAYRQYISAEVLHGYATAGAAGLNATDFFCLNLLSLAGTLTAGQLAQRTGLTTGATTRMIDRLEKAGFVRRARDAADRRQVIIEIIRDREPELDAALEPARRHMLSVFQRYSAQDLHVLLDYFTRAAPALVAAVEELQAAPASQQAPGEAHGDPLPKPRQVTQHRRDHAH
jgi:DNA-binding MarR family transcriptional regulator